MGDPSLGKVIVTTSNKVRAVKKLAEYWIMKSLMLQIKRNPRIVMNDGYQRKAAAFIEEHTQIADEQFWKNLNEDEKLRFAQFVNFQEVEETNIRIVPTKYQAEIYVVLNGSAKVQMGPLSEELNVGPGESFGSLYMFNKAMNGTSLSDDETYDHRKVVTAKISRGVLLRMSFHDYEKYILNPEKPFDDMREREEEAAIAEMPYQELSDEDIYCIKTYKLARKTFNNDLFMLMDAFRIIPRNASMSFKYHHIGNIGREVYMTEYDPLCIYAVLEGSMRLEVTTINENERHKVSFKGKGKTEMVVKTQTMPLMLLQAGSILCLQPECFNVIEEEAINKSKKVPKPINSEAFSRIKMTKKVIMTRSLNANTPLNFDLQQLNPLYPNKDDLHSMQKQLPPSLHLSLSALKVSNTVTVNSGRVSERSGSKSISKKIIPTNAATIPTNHGSNANNVVRRGSKTSVVSGHSNGSESGRSTPILSGRSKHGLHETTERLYQIRIVFDQNTRYFKVPLDVFNNSYTEPHIVAFIQGIREQLSFSSNTVFDRIKSLIPWITGNMEFNVANKLLQKSQIMKPSSSRRRLQPIQEVSALQLNSDEKLIMDEDHTFRLPVENNTSLAPVGSFVINPHLVKYERDMAEKTFLTNQTIMESTTYNVVQVKGNIAEDKDESDPNHVDFQQHGQQSEPKFASNPQFFSSGISLSSSFESLEGGNNPFDSNAKKEKKNQLKEKYFSQSLTVSSYPFHKESNKTLTIPSNKSGNNFKSQTISKAILKPITHLSSPDVKGSNYSKQADQTVNTKTSAPFVVIRNGAKNNRMDDLIINSFSESISRSDSNNEKQIFGKSDKFLQSFGFDDDLVG